MAPIPVVYDINVLVMATRTAHPYFRSWPSPPPTSTNPAADCIGVINDAAEFALWLSPHVLTNAGRILAEVLKWSPERAEAYLTVIVEAAKDSGGGVVEPPRTVHDCRDFEDNLILDLAVEVGALLIVSDDTDLTSMAPWRGTPILRPREFVEKVDGMRRHRRRGRT
jgi:predicted nucleic acid-binding protein